MQKLIRRLGNVLSALSLVMIININSATAATRLTPYHLYLWAKNANVARLEKFKQYINIKDYTTQNTAICIAQQHKDYAAYKLLLQFGASVRVPCHDNTDMQCRKIIKETGGIDTGVVLLGAVAVGAGTALALSGGGGGGGGSSGPACDITDYPLDACPEHGHCSTCEDKYKLDSCDRFWQKSGDVCIAAACPSGEAVKGNCPPAQTGTTLKEEPSDSFSGAEQCYTCSYICDTSAGFYQDRDICQETFPGYGCTRHTNGCFIRGEALDCPANEATECKPADPGYNLTETETGNLSGAQKCLLCTYTPKDCPANQYTNGNCPPQTGQKPAYNPTDNFSGSERCYTCSYSCNTEGGFYESKETCEAANSNKKCDENPASGCYTVTGCDTSNGYYNNEAELSAAHPGWTAKRENGCFVKGEAKPCENGTYTYGNCPTETGGIPSQTATSYWSGDNRCYRCSYACDTAGGYYNSSSDCENANQGHTCTAFNIPNKTCYVKGSCNTAEGYYNMESACLSANPGHTCRENLDSQCWYVAGCDNGNGYFDTPGEIHPGYEVEQQYGCYIEGEAKTCRPPETTFCQSTDPYKQAIENPTGNYAGETPCKTCTYQCRSQLGYYDKLYTCQDENQGHKCGQAPGSECFTPNDCLNNLGYYKTVSECESKNAGYNCAVSRSPNGQNTCYTIDKSNPKKCPSGEYLHDQCPPKEGTTAEEFATDNKQGDEQCYRCEYKCNETTHFTLQTSCETANTGRTCTLDANTGCYIKGGCDTAQKNYDEESACLENSPGHLCTKDPASECYIQGLCDEANKYYNEEDDCEANYNGYECRTAYGCYIKGDPADCPLGEYLACPDIDGTSATPTPTENKSGEEFCNTCAYTCLEEEEHYATSERCQEVNPTQFCNPVEHPDITCYIPSGCNEAAGFYKEQTRCESAAENKGYTCKQQGECWTKGEPAPCPGDEVTDGLCPPRDGNDVSQTPTDNMNGENQCYACVYTCQTAENYYADNNACRAANKDKACALDGDSQCYRVTGCDKENGKFDENGECTAANPGRTCTQDSESKCYARGGCDTAQKHYDDPGACSAANPGLNCEMEEESGCYIPTSCLTSAGYYKEKDDCEADEDNIGYICELQANGCYFNQGTPADCPENEYTDCEPRPEHTYIKNETGHFSGENKCYTCVYSCNTEENFHDKQTDCETANRGYKCDLTENGCYQKGAAKECPTDGPNPEYTECPTLNGKIPTEHPTDNFAGEKQCYTCTYGCDVENDFYDTEGACLLEHPGNLCATDDTGCHVPGNCNAAKGWYEDEANFFVNYYNYIS